MFGISNDEQVAFLTKLREDAVKDLDAQPDCPFRQDVFDLIDRDLQTALRAQQQEPEESHQKPRKTRKIHKPRKRAAP
jgi:hypothetical protein